MPSIRWIIINLFIALWSSLGVAQNAALVIIDMQPYFAEKRMNRSSENQMKVIQVFQRLRHLIRLAKEHQMDILVLEYSGCGCTDDVVMGEIGSYPKVKTFIKKRDGVFDDKSVAGTVKDYLDKRQITELVMSGANGGYCVRCSIEGAIRNGYRVWTDPYAIIDFTRDEFVLPYHYKDGVISLAQGEEGKFNQATRGGAIESVLSLTPPLSANHLFSQPAPCESVLTKKQSFWPFRSLFYGWRGFFGLPTPPSIR